MEDFNNWVMTIAGYITVTEYTVKFLLKWLLPKVRESLKKWRRRKRRR